MSLGAKAPAVCATLLGRGELSGLTLSPCPAETLSLGLHSSPPNDGDSVWAKVREGQAWLGPPTHGLQCWGCRPPGQSIPLPACGSCQPPPAAAPTSGGLRWFAFEPPPPLRSHSKARPGWHHWSKAGSASLPARCWGMSWMGWAGEGAGAGAGSHPRMGKERAGGARAEFQPRMGRDEAGGQQCHT